MDAHDLQSQLEKKCRGPVTLFTLWVFFRPLRFLRIPLCFLVLLTSLIFPPHLSCICLIIPALLPEFLPGLPSLPPHLLYWPSLSPGSPQPLSTVPVSTVFSILWNSPQLCSSSSISLYLRPVFCSVIVKSSCCVPVTPRVLVPWCSFMFACSLFFRNPNKKPSLLFSCLPSHAFGSTAPAPVWQNQIFPH